MSAQQYRPIFLSVSLLLTFMVFRRPRATRADHPEENPTAGDWALGLLAAASVGYAAVTADELFRRAAAPETLDIVGGRRDAADPRGHAPHGRLDPARDRAWASSPTPISAG